MPLGGFEKRMNYFGMRSAQICSLWKAEWGEESARVRCVMGGAPWDAPTKTALACPLYAQESGLAHCALEMDALAVAPYFGTYISDLPNQDGGYFDQLYAWTQTPDGGLDLLFHELRTGELLQAEYHRFGAIEAAAEIARANGLQAQAYGLALVAYEGGQHLSPTSPFSIGCLPWEDLPECREYRAIQELFIAANRDPRMGELYAEYLDAWRAAGGTLLMHYHAVGQPAYRYGAWGAKEFAGQSPLDAPKYSALHTYIEQNPCWWANCVRGEFGPLIYGVDTPLAGAGATP